jgi:outer membrane protein TolC
MKKIFLLAFFSAAILRGQITFNNLDSIFAYAEKNSATVKTATQQSLLAKWTKVAAIGNIVNFRNPLSFSLTDNTQLPVSFIPASVFGGRPGDLRPVTLGQQYVGNFNFNPQIDIINPYNLAKVKSSSLNKELTEVNNLLNKKNLFESIAATFYNILAFQEQIRITKQNISAADTLVFIAKNKFSQGIIREQDVNNLVVNQLNVKDKLNQLNISLEQQFNSLKVLCDIPSLTKINIAEPSGYLSPSYNSELKASSSLQFKSSVLQSEFMRSELRANRLSTLPVLSAVYYNGWQQNSNTGFFDSKSTWYQSQYIGLRISVPFPPDVNKLSQNYTSKINFRIAELNAEHTKLQNDLNNESLNLDYDKNFSSYTINKQVYELKNDNYTKSVNLYKEGIISTDILLTAFTDMLVSRLNFVSAKAALEFSRSKININNNIK